MAVPASVLATFNVLGPAVRLPGGQGQAVRAGGFVLKPVPDPVEAEWTASVFETLAGPGLRVPRPLRSADGRFVFEGWSAWRFIEGAHAGRNGGRWQDTVAACKAFHAAIKGLPRPAFMDTRSDAWAVADRMAWGEVPLATLPAFEALGDRLAALLEPIRIPSQVVHGDFTANVLFADGLEPGVIDFSPYWRPAGFAIGVIVADALTWGGADASILELAASVPQFAQLLVRAELRRLLELDQHTRLGRARFDQVAAHEPTVALIERYLRG